MGIQDGDKQTQSPSEIDEEFCFEFSLWKGLKLSAKGMDVATYKAMLSATFGLRSPIVWLLLLVIFLTMLLAGLKPEFTELFGFG